MNTNGISRDTANKILRSMSRKIVLVLTVPMFMLGIAPGLPSHTMGQGNPRPVAVAVNPNNGYAYVVNIGDATIGVICGRTPVTTIDLKTVTKAASPCDGHTPYGRCLNSVGINTVTGYVYVTEWFYDVAQIIRGPFRIEWKYAGRGPGGVVPHPHNDAVYIPDKWSSPTGVSMIRGRDYICPVTDPQCKYTIPITGCRPQAGAVDPVTGQIYFCCEQSNSVVVISGTQMIAEIPVGAHPNGIAYNPSNSSIYVVNSGDSPATVSVISDNQVMATVPVGMSYTDLGIDRSWGTELLGSTHIIAASPTGYVYVSNWMSNTVSVISDTQKITDIPVGSNPNAIGVDPGGGYVYVANIGSDSVSVISDTQVTGTVAVGDYPFDLAVNQANGYVYVVNRDDNSVSVLQWGELIETIVLPIPEFTPERIYIPICMKAPDDLLESTRRHMRTDIANAEQGLLPFPSREE